MGLDLRQPEIESGLTIGTTEITGGTVGRVLFEGAGNVVQQDSQLTFDGSTFQVQFAGALSTDENFKLLNSAGTANILVARGNGEVFSLGRGFVNGNTAFGDGVFSASTTGAGNTAFGYRAMEDLTGAAANCAFGYRALLNVTTGDFNNGFGQDALQGVTTGQYNIGIGYLAGQNLTTGSNNVYIGRGNKANAAASSRGVAIGYEAGLTMDSDCTFIGSRSGYLITGTNNAVFGQYNSLGTGITTGQHNTIIGRVQGLSNPSNNVVIADGQGNQVLRKDANHNQILGAEAALATTATNGFTYIPTCAGTPTGVPTAITGKVPIVADTTNNKLYVYLGGAWVAMN